MEGNQVCNLCQVAADLPEALVLASDGTWLTYVNPGLDDGSCVWVQTHRHAPGIWDLTPGEAASWGGALAAAATALRARRAAERVYVVSFGENHQHVHALVMGRPAAGSALRGTALVEATLTRLGDPDPERAARIATDLRPGFV